MLPRNWNSSIERACISPLPVSTERMRSLFFLLVVLELPNSWNKTVPRWVKEMKETDFKCVTLYECGNTKNVEKAEVGLIRSLNNENLGRLSCINEILGGGNCPAGAKTWVYFCYRPGGIDTFRINLRRIITGLGGLKIGICTRLPRLRLWWSRGNCRRLSRGHWGRLAIGSFS